MDILDTLDILHTQWVQSLCNIPYLQMHSMGVLYGCKPNHPPTKERKSNMYKQYAVVFQNIDTKRVKMDMFMGRTENEARYAWLQCYRHGKLIILSVTEIPE